MKKARLIHTAALVVFVLGLICALALCVRRVGMELENDRVCFIMAEEDAAVLSYVPETVTLFDGGGSFQGALLLIEDENQYSHLSTAETDGVTVWGDGATSAVRCFRLEDRWALRYAYRFLGCSDSEEIENIIYRAVTDRNIRVVWLRPMVSDVSDETITDGAAYEKLIDELIPRLAAQGISVGDSFSSFAAYTPPAWLCAGAFASALAAAWLLMEGLFKRNWLAPALLFTFCAGCALLWARVGGIAAGALAAACVFPCLAVTLAVKRLAAIKAGGGFSETIRGYLGALLPAFLAALAGGLVVGALQSSTEYLLAVYNFRGVKLSQAVPVAFAVFTVFKLLYGREGIKELLSGKKTLLLLCGVALLCAVTVFLLRTGDGALSAGALEQRFRNLLERCLIVRPRTKEFLIAWPCLGLACALFARGAKLLAWPFAIISAIGFSSVVNTFCHSRAPLLLSLARSALGLAFGLILGIIIAGAVCAVRGKRKAS